MKRRKAQGNPNNEIFYKYIDVSKEEIKEWKCYRKQLINLIWAEGEQI